MLMPEKVLSMKIHSNIQNKIESIFMTEPVSFAYLFGSYARGEEISASDIDIAILIDSLLSKEQRFDLASSLVSRLSKILGARVDIVVLNDIRSLFFKYSIFQDGKLLYKKQGADPVSYVSKIYALYFDFAPFLNKITAQYVSRNI